MVAMMVSLMPVIEVTRTRTHDGSDSSAFASARECANHRASRRADSNAFGCLHVPAVSVIMRSRIVPRGAHSYVGREDTQKHTESKNNGHQAVFHIHQLLAALVSQWCSQGEKADLANPPSRRANSTCGH
jgi:hypothetical protein